MSFQKHQFDLGITDQCSLSVAECGGRAGAQKARVDPGWRVNVLAQSGRGNSESPEAGASKADDGLQQ